MPFLRRLTTILGLLALLFGGQALNAATKKKAAAAEEGSFKGAIAIDAATGAVLFEDRAGTVTPPASMTKLMTFAVLFDKIRAGTLSTETEVKVDASDYRMGGTQVWLEPGEVFTVEELLYAMMIQSANDAAHALARTASGSVEAFVAEMNAKARELGMTSSTFRTPHGLPPKDRSLSSSDLTSPRDFATLSRHLVTHTNITKYTIRERKFGVGKRAEPVAMVNHNHLLGKVDGVDGLKTGFTLQAMYCLAATAERSGRRVIVVVMGGDTSKNRDRKVIELIEMAFTKLPPGTSQFVAEYKDTPTQTATNPDSPFAIAPLTDAEKAGSASTTSPAPAAEEEPMIKLNIPVSPKRPAKK